MEPAHIHRLQCSRQWRGFLAALAQEFVSALPPEELATLMARIGTRFAVAHPLPNSDTVRGLQDAMNGIWDPLDWGRAELGQNPAGMEVVHHFSPLVAAFGDTHAAWATGFLKGVYQQWFDAAGGSGLRVEVTTAADTLGSARLHLAAAA
ncbi:cellulose biosynthesis protein BcsD [Pulveribacter sp.]|uniref:cellulose biosynthesis protein BcsD n=1 Tax=Pulveribacter sp. TaxID=2678893 RepID=UPI0028A809C5|nr:cellulose biosynthesis protein BcsD [Pulveribacter sp.]